jgi:selenocysteine-specific elongation factor
LRHRELARRGWSAPSARVVGEWLVDDDAWKRWGAKLCDAVQTYRDQTPGRDGPSAATLASHLPDAQLLQPLAAAYGLTVSNGRVTPINAQPAVLPRAATAGLTRLREHLGARPFAAPEAEELTALGLDPRTLAVLSGADQVLLLPGNIALLPDAPNRAASVLATIEQPFTLSAARRALDTTRRVAVPLLEHLDRLRYTIRVDGSVRRMRPRS